MFSTSYVAILDVPNRYHRYGFENCLRSAFATRSRGIQERFPTPMASKRAKPYGGAICNWLSTS